MSTSFCPLRNIVRAAIVSAALAATPATASAGLLTFPGPDGAQGFCNLGTVSALSTTDVNDATTFSISNLISSKNSTGFFIGLPRQLFAPITFSVSDPLSLQFGTAEFGTFASTTLTQLSNDPVVGSRSFLAEGLFTKGTFGGTLVPNPAVTTFTISFNQNAGTGTAISVNATLSFNATQPVPEPTALVLAAAAVGSCAFFRLRRRGQRPAAA